jgi:hypothetical protein
MPFTSSDLANVDAAIASGELAVEVNGKRITYRSVDELKEARTLILGDIAAAGSAAGGTRRGAYRMTFTTARGD